jgi:hypothetical protein
MIFRIVAESSTIMSDLAMRFSPNMFAPVPNTVQTGPFTSFRFDREGVGFAEHSAGAHTQYNMKVLLFGIEPWNIFGKKPPGIYL